MDLENIERQRLALEANVDRLHRSLKHWQSWEQEYEGLKEELLIAEPEIPDHQTLLNISKVYDGSLVNEQEILELTGLTADSPRSRPQIIALIERRQEYVVRNIETISRQYFVAEGKLEEFAFASAAASGEDPRFGDEGDAGPLPLVEILEELDDDGNVLSSELRRPAEETNKIVERLKKAGLTEEDLSKPEDGQMTEPDHAVEARPTRVHPFKSALTGPGAQSSAEGDKNEATAHNEPQNQAQTVHRPPIRKKSVSFSADTKPAPEPQQSESQDGRKSVSFAPKVAIARAAVPPDTRSVSFSAKVEEIPAEVITTQGGDAAEDSAAADMQKDLRASFKPGERVYELNEDDVPPAQYTVMPENESTEEAQLRREMLEYHLNEVGDVVAQMELEEGIDDYSDLTGSEYLEEGDTPHTSDTSDEDEEEEDAYGRTKHRVISEKYHEQMKALQARLIGNLGPNPEDDDTQDIVPKLDPQDVRKLVIRGDRSSMSSAASSGSDGEKKTAGKKRVSFAQALDVSDPESLPLKAQKHVEGESVTPAGGNIIERTSGSNAVLGTDASSLRSSDTRAEDKTPEAQASSGSILADTLIERTLSTNTASAPSQDDEDPLLARRELATEYYKRRNDLIRQQGGFKGTPDEDEEHGELMEERDGKLKKVSRFKAARIRD